MHPLPDAGQPSSAIGMLSRQRRSSMVADTLKNQLLSGALKPGDKLPTETHLCKTYGVSRTTLREAIQTLRCTGLLDVTPGRGSFVRQPCMYDILSDVAVAASLLESGKSQGGLRYARLRAAMEVETLGDAVRAPLAERQALFTCIVQRDAPAALNAECEELWHLHLMRLAGSTAAELFVGTLLALERKERNKAYTNPDTVLRIMPLQMRISTALVEGDLPAARRLLAQLIIPGTPQETGMAVNTAAA